MRKVWDDEIRRIEGFIAECRGLYPPVHGDTSGIYFENKKKKTESDKYSQIKIRITFKYIFVICLIS